MDHDSLSLQNETSMSFASLAALSCTRLVAPMSIALATPVRTLLMALLAGALAALYSGCSDQGTERQGGGEVPDLMAGASPTTPEGGAEAGASGAAGAADTGAAGALPGGGSVQWCDAYKVINCVCQQCHQNPPLNGAPISLMTYEDTQKPFPFAASTKHVWNQMQTDVSTFVMPYMGDPNVSPPVKPLTDEQFDTLLTWLMEGAHPEGGTECTPTCDWSDGTPGL